MSYIEDYKAFKHKFNKCEEWSNLIGKEYKGGGGGIGRLEKIVIAMDGLSPQVYHQAFNGATNYHCMPPEFKDYVEYAIKQHSKLIMNTALEKMKYDVRMIAEQAKQEYESLLKDVEE